MGSELLDIRDIALDQLWPNEWNPFEQTSETFEILVNEIRESGFLEPIHVVARAQEKTDKPFMIVGGKHRWMAATEIGMDKIPAIVLGEDFEDEDMQKFMTVRLNVVQGKINPNKYLPFHKELSDKYGEKKLQKLLAFTDSAWGSLTKTVAAGVKGALPSSAGKAVDKAIQSAPPGSDLGKIVGHLLQKHGASLVHGFMVFSFGGQDNVYIAMTTEAKEALFELLEITEERSININLLMAPMLRSFVDQLAEEGSTKPTGEG